MKITGKRKFVIYDEEKGYYFSACLGQHGYIWEEELDNACLFASVAHAKVMKKKILNDNARFKQKVRLSIHVIRLTLTMDTINVEVL